MYHDIEEREDYTSQTPTPTLQVRYGRVCGIESLGDEFQTYSLKVLEQIEEEGSQQNKYHS